MFVYAGGSSIVSGSSSGPASSCWMMFTARKLGGTGLLRETLVEGADDWATRSIPPPYPLAPCSDVDVERYDCRRSRWEYESGSLEGTSRYDEGASRYEEDAIVGAGRVNGSGW